MNREKNRDRRWLKILLTAAVVVALLAGAYFAGRNSTPDREPGQAANLDVITAFDYGDKVTYTIGHKSPDTDTVMSAIAMANLLNQIGITSEARIGGTPNGETNYLAEKLGIQLPEILTDASDCQLWLVDHSMLSQAVSGAEEARIVGIVDHHGIGDAGSSEQIFVRSAMTGATATQIWQLYKDLGVVIDNETAEVLLCGILSDTSGMQKSVTGLEREAFEDLKKIAGISDTNTLYAGMKDAKTAYIGMTDTEIYYNDYKEYEASGYSYGIGIAETKTADEVDAMADRMEKVMEEESEKGKHDFLVAIVFNIGHEYSRVIFTGKDEAFLEKLAGEAFVGTERFSVSEKNTAIFKPSVSRKSVIVPCIDEFLEKYAWATEIDMIPQ